MRGIDAAFERLQIVAALPELRHEALSLGHQGPLEIGKSGWRAGRPHVGPDHAAALGARVGRQGDLVRKRGLRPLVGHVDAAAVHAVLPAVIDAAQAALLVAGEIERRAPVGAELAAHRGAPARVAIGDQVLTEDPHALGPAAGRELGGLHDGDPVLAHQLAHERSGPDARQLGVLFGS